ncbi:hypothetical protein ACWD3J_46480 [Streptomyces sp. NPDC002755]|uniref:hypothetical protein n=1 Tax=Streptomyces sp. NPDC002884 TaxID=3154544 RepID=UPI0033263348
MKALKFSEAVAGQVAAFSRSEAGEGRFVVLKRGRKGELGIEILPLLEMALAEPPGGQPAVLLRDRHPETIDAISDALRKSLDNVSRLQGHQTQYAFEAVVVALGAIRLIKTEDAGLYYFDDAQGKLLPPDFRIVLRDGTVLLVEVKSVKPGAEEKVKVRADDMDAAQAYARMTHGRLLYAHYWAGLNLWTLVDPSRFDHAGTQRRLTISSAMRGNEMALLGDTYLAGKPPLTVSVLFDPTEEEPSTGEDAPQGERLVAITGRELSNAGEVITAPLEQKLAWFLARYSGWSVENEMHTDEDGRFVRLDYHLAPDVDEEASAHYEQQGFAVFGALSSLYTSRFRMATTTEHGEITALRQEPSPALMTQLLPDDYWDEDRVLKLWRFVLAPT